MNDIRKVQFQEKDIPLRQDVSLLGTLLGEALLDQEGPALLEQIERVRKAAIGMREGSSRAAQSLEQELLQMDVETIAQTTKAFSTYLRLANLAEKNHRIRRRRHYLKQGAQPQRGSLDDVFAEMAAAGCTDDSVRQTIERLRIRPVFTAHPTEATRRSFLEKEYSIIHRLVDLQNPDRTPEEEQQILDRIADAIHSAWQTSTVPQARPSVADELDNVLFYLTDILYRVVGPFHESLQRAINKHYPGLGKIDAPELLRFGSWVGGDMDGNPNVTAQTLLDSLRTQRSAIIRNYLPDVRRLASYLSQSQGMVGFDPAVLQQLASYEQELPQVTAQIPIRHRDMPYRCLLHYVYERLKATLSEQPGAYQAATGLQRDIELIAHSLVTNAGHKAGLFGVERLLEKIRTFGFHLATLDARQDAQVHRDAAASLLSDPKWSDRPIKDRCAVLTQAWHQLPAPDIDQRSDVLQATLEVFRAIARARSQYGPQATGLFIISMTQGPDDVLTALALAKAAGMHEQGRVPLDIAPLLETVDDLDAGPEIIDHLLQQPVYREHLKARHDRQVIMVGYSDSNKDSGIVAARWGLWEAQKKLMDTGRKHGITIHFFHGRGGTVSRGGGNLVAGIEGAPTGSIDGYLRITEQGEVINQKYGIRPIALRNLELMTGAVLRHQALDTSAGADQQAREIMSTMARSARHHYQNLVFEHPDFVPFFRAATPIDVIERLNIGSRPASRRSGQGIENLRAIPWVFSWAQIRVGLPGVYGMGTALSQVIDTYGLPALQDLYERWSFFRALVADVEMVLAKSTLSIGQRYAQLAAAEHRPIFTLIEQEFDRATQTILRLREHQELLQDQHSLRQNIRLRNPYADPMHLLQIDLLQRWRAGQRQDETLLRALKSTVNGIALAIQNTG